MTAFVLNLSMSYLLVIPIGFVIYLYVKSKKQICVKYLQHTTIEANIRAGEPNKEDVHVLELWRKNIGKWIDHFAYPSLYGKPETCVWAADIPAKILDVIRRSESFPYTHNRETWLVTPSDAVREGDGVIASQELFKRFVSMIRVAEAYNKHTELLGA